MGTKERLEILIGTQSKGKTQETINDLLKRISNLEFEVERLTKLCDKYEEEHSTTFEEWKKDINIIKEIKHYIKDTEQDGYLLVWLYKDNTYFEAGIKEILESDKEWIG